MVGGLLNKHTHKSQSASKVDVCKLNAALESKTTDNKLLKAHGNDCLSISFNIKRLNEQHFCVSGIVALDPQETIFLLRLPSLTFRNQMPLLVAIID